MLPCLCLLPGCPALFRKFRNAWMPVFCPLEWFFCLPSASCISHAARCSSSALLSAPERSTFPAPEFPKAAFFPASCTGAAASGKAGTAMPSFSFSAVTNAAPSSDLKYLPFCASSFGRTASHSFRLRCWFLRIRFNSWLVSFIRLGQSFAPSSASLADNCSSLSKNALPIRPGSSCACFLRRPAQQERSCCLFMRQALAIIFLMQRSACCSAVHSNAIFCLLSDKVF